MRKCVDCGNNLSPTAKTCGNLQCFSSDPFGKERLKTSLSRIFGVVVIAGAGLLYYYQFGFANPIEVLRHPFQTQSFNKAE
jgi:hypothetical protein